MKHRSVRPDATSGYLSATRCGADADSWLGLAWRGSPDSDIDLLVDFAAPKGFFELIRLEDELKAFFGRPVDVVTEPGLSPYLREPILANASVIFDAAA